MAADGPPGSRRTNEPGPVGQRVAANVRALRRSADITTREMSRMLADEVGRPIAATGITKIEAGADGADGASSRRVDADDLVALALVLDASPLRLLLGPTADQSPMTLVGDVEVIEDRAWEWAVGDRPLDLGPGGRQDQGGLDRRRLLDFQRRNRPHRSPGRTISELRELRDQHGEALQTVVSAVREVRRRGVPLDAVIDYVELGALQWDQARDGDR